jgi:hypothetical protein
MFRELDAAIATIESFVRGFEPGLLNGRGAVRALERFARVTHLGQAGAALAARRADETYAYRDSGARSAADWMARKTGVAVAHAERALETVAVLDELPATSDAFRSGQLSEAQAHEITQAAQRDPSAEAGLVDEVRGGASLKTLKDKCRRVRPQAEADDQAWAQRLHDTRHLRRWVDGDSAPCGMYKLSPDKGAELHAAIDAEVQALVKEAKATGAETPSLEALAADALHSLVLRGPRKPVGINLVMDAAAGQQGFTRPGQRCEIPGVGPIPVTLAKKMLAGGAQAGEAGLPRRPPPTRPFPRNAGRGPAKPARGEPRGFATNELARPRGGLAASQPPHPATCRVGRGTRGGPALPVSYHHDLKTTKGWTIQGEPHDWELVPPGTGPDPP